MIHSKSLQTTHHDGAENRQMIIQVPRLADIARLERHLP